jgi:hypothetical protein
MEQNTLTVDVDCARGNAPRRAAAPAARMGALLCMAFAASFVAAEETATPQSSSTTARDYFAIGAWRIGMPRDEALTHFTAVEALESPGRFRAMAPSKFGTVPATLSFTDDGLATVELTYYEGQDREAALRSLVDVLKGLHEEFGGSNFEGGIKYHDDPQGESIRIVVEGLIARVDASLEKGRKKAERKKQDPGSYTMVFSYWTEFESRGNFLYGQYVFDRDLQRVRIKLWEDREFVKSRVPATIHLRTESEAPR